MALHDSRAHNQANAPVRPESQSLQPHAHCSWTQNTSAVHKAAKATGTHHRRLALQHWTGAGWSAVSQSAAGGQRVGGRRGPAGGRG
eukprot:CAMPEP_0174364116 /NCGR_PEP_ID=MMETSP0811_2-20130205/71608_1 /TAXON_ID=73025 ORGANISM="Eutreptiella gymnastica-like, Strain CCMP1594" /NCGR_SAMPLE_ID=MMETSP0811_2 /ASSEMBLY_ACC=CAM_ASM_000667 /LENGTH=86 /DNA_ID=CAMNT_0015503461 /DNA_START=77 /DNA_END=335 /DNA_ORIENTATION=-